MASLPNRISSVSLLKANFLFVKKSTCRASQRIFNNWNNFSKQHLTGKKFITKEKYRLDMLAVQAQS